MPKPKTRRIRGENAERALELSLGHEGVVRQSSILFRSAVTVTGMRVFGVFMPAAVL